MTGWANQTAAQSETTAANIAAGCGEVLTKIEVLRQKLEDQANSYAQCAGIMGVFKGVRWTHNNVTWNQDDDVIEVGLGLATNHDVLSLQILMAQEVGRAAYERTERFLNEKRFGPGAGAQAATWQMLAKRFFADEIALSVTGASVSEWARAVLGALHLECVNVRRDLGCGGESIVLRYEHLSCMACSGQFRSGEFVDIRGQLRDLGYLG